MHRPIGKLLVVSRCAPTRHVFSRAIQGVGGFEVWHSFGNSDAAAKLSGDSGFVAVLVEGGSSPVEALELAKAIRAGRISLARGTPYGLVVDEVDQALMRVVLDLDINDVLVKPLSPKLILSRVKRLASSRTRLRAIESYQSIPIPGSQNESLVFVEPLEEEALNFLTADPIIQSKPAYRAAVAQSSDPGAAFGPIERLLVSEVDPGSKILQDVLNENAVRLVGAGTVISSRLLCRLQELDSVASLGKVLVRRPLMTVAGATVS